MGAYAVEYITSVSRAQRGYYEIDVQISYRRTAEQIQAVVNATSTEALYSLLETALDSGRTELAVRIGYWGQDGAAKVESAMSQLREERGLTEEQAWVVRYYPASGPVGLIEFLMDPDEEDLEEAALAEPPAPEPEEDSGEDSEEPSEKNE